MKRAQSLPAAPCYGAANGQDRQAFRRLCRTANGLGVLLFFVGIASSALMLALHLFLIRLGYLGDPRYGTTAYLDPVLYYLMTATVTTLTFLVPGLLYMAVTRMPLGRVLPSAPLRPSIWVSLFFLGSALALLSNLPVNWLSDLWESLFPAVESGGGIPPSISAPQTGAPMPWFARLLSLLQVALLPAFFEEFLFRGVLMGQLRRWGDGFAVFTSALLFGLFHSSLRQVPFAFLVGLVLGWIVVRTNHIWLSIAIHGFNNSFSALQDLMRAFLPAEMYLFLYNLIFFGTLVLGAVGALVVLWRQRDFYLPRHTQMATLPTGKRLLLWFLAPGTLLALAYCIVQLCTDWL